MIELPNFLSYPNVTCCWSGRNPAPHSNWQAKAAADVVAAADSHLAYSNAGNILSPSFEPPGNTIVWSTNLRLS